MTMTNIYNDELEITGKPRIFKDKTWGVLVENIPADSVLATKAGFENHIAEGNVIVTVIASNGKTWKCTIREIAWLKRTSKEAGSLLSAKLKVDELVDPNRKVFVPEGKACFANLGGGKWGVRVPNGVDVETGEQLDVEKRGGAIKKVIVGELITEGEGYRDFSITPWRKKKGE